MNNGQLELRLLPNEATVHVNSIIPSACPASILLTTPRDFYGIVESTVGLDVCSVARRP